MDRQLVLSKIQNGLIVSCQADEGEPLDSPSVMAAFARAAVRGGAFGIRAERPKNLIAIADAVDVPVIGLFKKKYSDSEVYITPTREEAVAILKTGVSIIALDATMRPRPHGEKLNQIIRAIREQSDALIMADISTLEEGIAAANLGVDLIGTTLSGYTENSKRQSVTEKPDFRLISELNKQFAGRIPIVAEGRIWTPGDAVEAFRCSAFAIVVGTAITRPTVITRQINDAIQRFHQRKNFNAIGIDLGGTKTAVGVVSADGIIIRKKVVTSPWDKGMAKVVSTICSIILELMDNSIETIGIAAGGRVDYEKGIVSDGVPLADDYLGYPLADMISKAIHRPVILENDANAAAMAEYRIIDPPKPDRMVGITIGTGIGGGIIIEGKLFRGSGNAGEIGHICIQKAGRKCACGRSGCLETYVSRKLLQSEIAKLIQPGKVVLPETHDMLDTDAMIKLIQSGHPDVMKIFHQQLDYLACGIESIINTMDPDLIVLGGEIARLGDALCDGIKSRLLRPVNLKTSALGNDAGLIGAALLAFEKLAI